MAGASKRRRTYDGRARKRMRSTAFIKRSMAGVPEHRFVRKWLSGTWIWSSATTTGFWRAYNPTLGDMPGTERNEIIGMYDQYKINYVRITFVPRFTDYDAGASTLNPCPVISYYPDATNAPSAPAGTYVASTYERFAARANGSFVTTNMKGPISVGFKPMVQTTDGETKPFPWTTVLRTDIPANAAQVFIHGVNFSNLPATGEFDVFITFDMSGRGLR